MRYSAARFAFVPAILAALAAGDARAAACCGGSSASPSLISGDDAYQFGVTVSNAEVIGDAPETGRPVFRGSNSDEVTRTLRFDAAAILSDRTQASVSVPFASKSVRAGDASNSSSSMGDLSLGFGYEAWPQWTYSEWKPRGFLFAQLNIPVAHSIYDTEAQGATDALGTGFYRTAIGALFLKAWRVWDASFTPEAHYSLSKTFTDGSGNPLHVRPGFGASADLGFGYNFIGLPVRLGFRLQPVWNQARAIEMDGMSSRSSDQWVWNAGLEFSYLVSDQWSATASYTDQTLLGPAVNTSLSRTFALGLQRRFPR